MRTFFTLMMMYCIGIVNVYAQWQTIAINGVGMNTSVSKLYKDGTTLWAGSIGKVFKSTDNGATWNDVSTGLQSAISGNSGIIRLDNRMYASFAGNGNWFTYYSTNEGQNWVLDTVGWKGPAPIQLHTHKDYVLARLESNFILYKKNTDTTWNVLSLPQTHRTPGWMYSIGDTLVLGAGYVALTTDMGANWTFRQTVWPQGLPLGYLNGFYQDKTNPSRIFANYMVLATNKPKFFYTNNNQITWDSISLNLPQPLLVTAMHVNGNELYAAVEGTFTTGDTTQKFFHSTNGGTTWSNITENLYSLSPFKFHSVTSIEIMGGKIITGGLSVAGICVRNTGSSGLLKNISAQTLQLYPNPVTQTLHLSGNLQKIEVINLNGQTILTQQLNIENGIDVSQMPPGIYMVKAIKDGEILTSKFIKQ